MVQVKFQLMVYFQHFAFTGWPFAKSPFMSSHFLLLLFVPTPF